MNPLPTASRTLLALLVSLSFSLGGVAQAATDVTASTPMIGLGTEAPSYYSGAQAMVDVTRESTALAYDWSGDVATDSNGAPTADFHIPLTSRILGAGTYKLVFKGQAVLFAGSTGVDDSAHPSKVLNQIYDATTNTTTADLWLPINIKSGWLSFKQTMRTPASTPGDGLTDVHLYRPGYGTSGSQYFTNEYIQAMRKVQVIRTMDFTMANRNDSVEWVDRPTMKRVGRDTNRGEPWELVVKLANETNRDIWINVPPQASNDYITKLARLLRYGSDGVNPYTRSTTNPVYPGLNSGLKVYVEYGNEIWNWGYGFMGARWASALANQYMADTTHPIAFDGVLTDTNIALRRWTAYRSASISQIFRTVWGSSNMMSRVRPVLTSQAGNPITLSTGLKWADAFYSKVRTSPVNSTVRAVNALWWGAGGTAYYDSSSAPIDTTEATMAAYFAGLPDATFGPRVATDASWARAYGLVSTAYEGGPGPGGVVTGGASPDKVLQATYNADPRMTSRMVEAQKIYEANGGQFLSYFVYAGGGPWSFINDLTPQTVSDTTAPKLLALDQINAAAKTSPTLGQLAPTTIWLRDATADVVAGTFSSSTWAYGGAAYRLSTPGEPGLGETVLVPVRSSRKKTYSLSVTTFNAPSAAKLEVLVNGVSAGTITMVGSTTGTAVRSASISASLSSGLNFVRLRSTSGEIWVKDVVLQ